MRFDAWEAKVLYHCVAEREELLCPMSSLASHVSIAVSTGTSEGGNDVSLLAAHWTGNECSRIKSHL